MQFGGSDATSGRQGHDNAPSHTSSPNHRLCGSPSQRLLAVPYSENKPQGDTFRNRGGHEIECDVRTPEDSKRSLPPVLPEMGGTIGKLCIRNGPTLKVII
jgi:hypothetical protein